MFEVEIHQSNHYWNRLIFKFEKLEEAQQFIGTALTHVVTAGEDEDEDCDVIIDLRYAQRFSTAKDESDESSE